MSAYLITKNPDQILIRVFCYKVSIILLCLPFEFQHPEPHLLTPQQL